MIPRTLDGVHLSWPRSAYGTDADVRNSDDSLMPKVAAEDDPETRTRKTPGFLRGKNALVWSRHFSSTKEACQCELLDRVLSMVGASGASRMVVGKSYTKYYIIIIIISSHIVYRHVMMCAGGCDGLFGLRRFPHAHRINPSSVFTIQLHRYLHVVLTCTPVRLTCHPSLSLLRYSVHNTTGHTIQEGGITSACDGKVFRVDVGLSKGCGDGPLEVLEIINDEKVRVVPKESRQTLDAMCSIL